MKQARHDVLNGWKEIASYLGRDPRTVERWEKQRSLPVRRLPGSGRASVYALKGELDQWLALAPTRQKEETPLKTDGTSSMGGGSSEDTLAFFPPDGESLPEPATITTATPAEATGAEATRVRLPSATPVRLPAAMLGSGWRSAGFFLLALCCLALAALGWRHVHRSPWVAESAVPASTGLPSRMLPSSKVPGVEELYLRARYQSEQRTPDSLNRALANLQAAIARDPEYAPAYAGLASTYVLLREYSLWPDREAFPRAKAAAQRAIALDPALAEAHAELGFVEFFWDWDPPDAEAEFRTALRLDPALPLAHHWFGSMLTHEGRFAEALPELKLAQHLDPSSGAILTVYALALAMHGSRGEAADLLQEAISNGGQFPDRNPATMHSVLGMLSLMNPADLPRYLAECSRGAELRKDTDRGAILRYGEAVYKAHGEQAMWRALLEQEQHRHPHEVTYAMARYEARLGAKEQALTHLATLVARHDPEMMGISVDPMLFGLRHEPRYGQIRASMRLPPLGEPG